MDHLEHLVVGLCAVDDLEEVPYAEGDLVEVHLCCRAVHRHLELLVEDPCSQDDLVVVLFPEWLSIAASWRIPLRSMGLLEDLWGVHLVSEPCSSS